MKIAVIPARGGSKRIPRKNIRDFLGKPIIGYSIEAAIESGLFDQVVVSTDDAEIADVAKNYGAVVPFLRPVDLADDQTGTSAVVKHAIEWFEANGSVIDYVCCIYATAPFLDVDYLRNGYQQLEQSDKAFAFSVTSFPFPIQRALRIDEQGAVDAFYPEYAATRSQDLEHAYHDAGQFYWGRRDGFMHDVRLFSTASLSVILPRHLVQDIDTEEDWHRAELMFQALKANGERLR